MTLGAAALPLASSTAGTGEMDGITGTILDVIEALGAAGVGLLTVVETVFPPLPSEVILPLAGYLAERGRLDLWAVLAAATAGSLIGAWLLFAAGAKLGRERATLLLARLPLLDREDVDAAADWFDRHGPWAVFFGRLVPGVRSLISLPAGASGMGWWHFTWLTALGSLIWNVLLVGAGYLLGTQWRTVERYSEVLDLVVYGAIAGSVLWLAVRRFRKRRRAAAERRALDPDLDPASPLAAGASEQDDAPHGSARRG